MLSLHRGHSLTALSFPSLFCCYPGTRGNLGRTFPICTLQRLTSNANKRTEDFTCSTKWKLVCLWKNSTDFMDQPTYKPFSPAQCNPRAFLATRTQPTRCYSETVTCSTTPHWRIKLQHRGHISRGTLVLSPEAEELIQLLWMNKAFALAAVLQGPPNNQLVSRPHHCRCLGPFSTSAISCRRWQWRKQKPHLC